MLEHYLKSARLLDRLRSGPLSGHLDDLAARLHRQRFTWASGRRILGLAGKFNEFALGVGVEEAAQIDAGLVEHFVNKELKAKGIYGRDGESLLRHLLEHLRAKGLLSPLMEPDPDDPFASILARYDRHLASVRGLAASSRAQYRRYARRLLEWFRGRHGERPLARLRGVDVLEYITDCADLHPSGSWRNNLCSLTRGFLRFLRWEGIIEVDLDRVVPTLPHWRLQTVPRHLPWQQVRALIDSVDATRPIGMRDKAVLLSIALLGLRNQEVRRLALGDLRWRAGAIRLPETKSRRERVLPLPQELGTALAEYVLRARPRLDVPQVFVRHRAPQGPITSTSGIVYIVRKHLQRAGIRAPSHGAHLLRHSLATRMVNQGVAIKQVADVLGHVSIDTTAIYTKVNTRSLSAVALPFPGGEA